jgi:hypothetical protein
MPASMAGIWLRIADNQEPTRDHSDQVVCNPTDDANRQAQSPSEMTSNRSSRVGKIHQPEQAIVNGFVQMVTDRLAAGWSGYLVTIVFRQIPGPRHVVLSRMKDELQRVYSTLVTRVHRKPKTAPVDELPVLIAVADLPVFKLDRAKSSGSCNDGLHFHAILLLPATSRLRESPVDHFHSHADLYAGLRKLVDRIHIKPATHDYDRLVDYVFKTVLNRRIPYDEAILVLPRTHRELGATRDRPKAEAPAHRRILPLPS